VGFAKEPPCWWDLAVRNCLLRGYEAPASVKAIVDGVPMVAQRPSKARVRIAERPFAAGAERLAYFGRDMTNRRNEVDIVLKKYLRSVKTATRYEAAIEMQTIAAFLASQFTAQLMEKVGTVRRR
jgi:hypothetical protein